MASSFPSIRIEGALLGPELLDQVMAAAASDFPGETFRVLKQKEQTKFGEYCTRRLVLEAWSKLTAA